MPSIAKTLLILTPLLFAAWGCESVALIGRPAIEREGEYRGRDYGREAAREEVVGTVDRVDWRDREIHLRTPQARTAVVRYDSNTLVVGRGRDVRVEDLRAGDLVLVQLRRDSLGDPYADVIRLRDREDIGSRR
ncbi:MAG TPA: hypothetical protein VNL14_23915 [Candidatus Acidoferrales bacterium]|nr:hypothetical protein [Candidatus Acidoferrales bacterium]